MDLCQRMVQYVSAKITQAVRGSSTCDLSQELSRTQYFSEENPRGKHKNAHDKHRPVEILRKRNKRRIKTKTVQTTKAKTEDSCLLVENRHGRLKTAETVEKESYKKEFANIERNKKEKSLKRTRKTELNSFNVNEDKETCNIAIIKIVEKIVDQIIQTEKKCHCILQNYYSNGIYKRTNEEQSRNAKISQILGSVYQHFDPPVRFGANGASMARDISTRNKDFAVFMMFQDEYPQIFENKRSAFKTDKHKRGSKNDTETHNLNSVTQNPTPHIMKDTFIKSVNKLSSKLGIDDRISVLTEFEQKKTFPFVSDLDKVIRLDVKKSRGDIFDQYIKRGCYHFVVIDGVFMDIAEYYQVWKGIDHNTVSILQSRMNDADNYKVKHRRTNSNKKLHCDKPFKVSQQTSASVHSSSNTFIVNTTPNLTRKYEQTFNNDVNIPKVQGVHISTNTQDDIFRKSSEKHTNRIKKVKYNKHTSNNNNIAITKDAEWNKCEGNDLKSFKNDRLGHIKETRKSRDIYGHRINKGVTCDQMSICHQFTPVRFESGTVQHNSPGTLYGNDCPTNASNKPKPTNITQDFDDGDQYFVMLNHSLAHFNLNSSPQPLVTSKQSNYNCHFDYIRDELKESKFNGNDGFKPTRSYFTLNLNKETSYNSFIGNEELTPATEAFLLKASDESSSDRINKIMSFTNLLIRETKGRKRFYKKHSSKQGDLQIGCFFKIPKEIVSLALNREDPFNKASVENKTLPIKDTTKELRIDNNAKAFSITQALQEAINSPSLTSTNEFFEKTPNISKCYDNNLQKVRYHDDANIKDDAILEKRLHTNNKKTKNAARPKKIKKPMSLQKKLDSYSDDKITTPTQRKVPKQSDSQYIFNVIDTVSPSNRSTHNFHPPIDDIMHPSLYQKQKGMDTFKYNSQRAQDNPKYQHMKRVPIIYYPFNENFKTETQNKYLTNSRQRHNIPSYNACIDNESSEHLRTGKLHDRNLKTLTSRGNGRLPRSEDEQTNSQTERYQREGDKRDKRVLLEGKFDAIEPTGDTKLTLERKVDDRAFGPTVEETYYLQNRNGGKCHDRDAAAMIHHTRGTPNKPALNLPKYVKISRAKYNKMCQPNRVVHARPYDDQLSTAANRNSSDLNRYVRSASLSSHSLNGYSKQTPSLSHSNTTTYSDGEELITVNLNSDEAILDMNLKLDARNKGNEREKSAGPETRRTRGSRSKNQSEMQQTSFASNSRVLKIAQKSTGTSYEHISSRNTKLDEQTKAAILKLEKKSKPSGASTPDKKGKSNIKRSVKVHLSDDSESRASKTGHLVRKRKEVTFDSVDADAKRRNGPSKSTLENLHSVAMRRIIESEIENVKCMIGQNSADVMQSILNYYYDQKPSTAKRARRVARRWESSDEDSGDDETN